MSILSFLVNLVSLYLFHGVKQHDHSHKTVKHNHDEHCHSEQLEVVSCHGHSHNHNHKHNHNHYHIHSNKHNHENKQLNSISIPNETNHHENCFNGNLPKSMSPKSSIVSKKKKSIKFNMVSPIETHHHIPSLAHSSKNSKISSCCKEKMFNQSKLKKNETSEKILKTVKSSLEITSKGLLSVFLIGDKIIENSKNALSSKKTNTDVGYNFPEERIRILDGNNTEDMNKSGNCDFQNLRCSEVINGEIKTHKKQDTLYLTSNVSQNDNNNKSDQSSFLEDYEENEEECNTGHIGHCHSHDMNFTGMLIHLLGDVISSLCVIISSIVVVKYKWVYFDSICSIIICIAIILSTVPLNYIIFKKMKAAFSVTKAEEKYITLKINEVMIFYFILIKD